MVARVNERLAALFTILAIEVMQLYSWHVDLGFAVIY
jgi:hypothetical protein